MSTSVQALHRAPRHAAPPTPRGHHLSLRSPTLFLLASLPLVLLYAATRARTVTGEDSGELITAAYTLGIAHPPGYPLWVLLTKGFQVLFSALTPADAANLASAVTTAAAIGVLAVLARRLTGSTAAALTGALLAGLSHEIWNHATIAEVYPLSLLLFALSLLAAHRWIEAPAPGRLFLLAGALGLGISHHPTFLLFLPAFGLLVVLRHPKILWTPKDLWIALFGLVLPLAFHVQVWLAAAGDPLLSWGVEPSFRSVLGHFLREAYAGSPEKTPETWAKLGGQIRAFAQFHVENLGAAGWIVGLVGLGLFLSRERLFGSILALLLVAGSFGLIPLLNFDLEREDVFVNRVFLMPAYMLLGLGLAGSISFLLSRLPRRLVPRLAGLILLVPGAVALAGYSGHDRSRYFWAEDYARAILSPLPANTLLFPGGDTTTFPLLYLQACEGVRRDVQVLDRSGTIERDEAVLLLPERVRQEALNASRSDLVQALVRLSGRPVCVLRPERARDDAVYEPLGMGFLALDPRDREGRARIRERQAGFVRDIPLRNPSVPSVEDYTSDIVQAHVAQVRALACFRSGDPPRGLREADASVGYGAGIKETFNNVGSLVAENGLPEKAERYFRQALRIRGDYTTARRNLLVTLRMQGKDREALEEAAAGLRIEARDPVLFEEGAEAAMAVEDGAALTALCTLRMDAVPGDPSPHRFLGLWAAEHAKSPSLAKRHFEAALRLDPRDEVSARRLDEARSRLGEEARVPDPAGDLRGAAVGVASVARPVVRRPFERTALNSGRARPRVADESLGFVPGAHDASTVIEGSAPPGIPAAPQVLLPGMPRIGEPIGEPDAR